MFIFVEFLAFVVFKLIEFDSELDVYQFIVFDLKFEETEFVMIVSDLQFELFIFVVLFS